MSFADQTALEYERHLDAIMARRVAAENRALDRLERRERAAEPLIGEMCRDGRMVNYINLRPLHKGRIKVGAYSELMDYLLRNRYA